MAREVFGVVQAILYRHLEDGKEYVHVFGGGEPTIIRHKGGEFLRVDTLPRSTRVKMYADNDDVVFVHMDRKELSRHF